MSVFFVNSEEIEDSPPNLDNGHSSESDGNGMQNDIDYSDLTVQTFWPKITEEIRKINELDIRNQALPLARIKKIMKLDEDVKMISGEAPMLFAKACELFIMELSLRAWIHTEDNKRRTLQRSDIAMAISKYDQFDFLIDIVPREEAKNVHRSVQDSDTKPALSADQLHYYFQLAQQQSNETAANQNISSTVANPAAIQIIQSNSAVPTVAIAGQSADQSTNVVSNNAENVVTASDASHIIVQNSTQNSTNQANNIQLLQQILTPSGEVQNIPVVVQLPWQQRRK